MNQISSVSPGRKRILYVDVAKCVALIFIVVCHTEWSHMVSFVDNMALPVFWICSGFTSRSDFSIRRKARALLVPYILLSAICLIFTLMITHAARCDEYIAGFLYSRWKIFAAPLSDANPPIMTMHNSVLWFLTSLFAAFCLLKIVFLTARSFRAQVIALVLLILAQWGLLFLPVLLPWSLDTAPFVASLMLVGHWLREYRLLEKKKAWIIGLLCAAIYAVANRLCGPTNYSIREMGEVWPSAFVCGVSGTFVLLYQCRLAGDNAVTRFLSVLNSQALFIFGLQLVFIALSAFVTTRLPEISLLRMSATVVICFTGGFLTGRAYNKINRISNQC